MKRLYAYIVIASSILLPSQNIEQQALIKRDTLSNGIKVVHIYSDEQPVSFVSCRINIGKLHTPLDALGIHTMTFDLLDKGSKDMTKSQISDALSSIGTTISIYSGSEYSTLSSKCMSYDLDSLISVFYQIIVEPLFSKNEFNKYKKRKVQSANLWKNNSLENAANHAKAVLYGLSPYGIVPTKKDIRSISLQDVQDFYSSVDPHIVTFYIHSNIDREESLTILEKYFSNWNKLNLLERPRYTYNSFRGVKSIFIDNPTLDQSTIYISKWSEPKYRKNHYAVDLANHIIGGSFHSRINRRLRINGGKTYGAESYHLRLSDVGRVATTTSTRTSETMNTLLLIIDEMGRAGKFGVTQEEILKAKKYLSGSVPLDLEYPSSMINRILSMDFYGKAYNEPSGISNDIKYVPIYDVNVAAMEYYGPKDFVLTIVGDYSEVSKQIKLLDDFHMNTFFKDMTIYHYRDDLEY